jgi:hypothetical protein
VRHLLIIPVCALMVACTPAKRYTAVASACETYAVALNTAAELNRAGKLTASAQSKIDATVGPAKAVCSGSAPSDDPEAVRKVSALVIAVLEAQK